ncbi:MAG: glycosyltransferase family 4 protein [Candidatus Nanohaloarchaea archaeon]
MKVLMVGWGFPPDIDGGLDIHVSELFKQLRSSSEVEVDLALPEKRAPDINGIMPVKTGKGDMIQRARNMSQEIANMSGEYDVLHSHDWLGAEAGFKAKKYSNIGWITTFHSLSSGRSRSSSERIERMEKAAAEGADRLVAVSNSLAKEVNDRYGVKPDVIHNGFRKPSTRGVDVKKMLGIEEEMIFYVGRHAEQKNIELLLRAFKKLDRGTLVIGGRGHLTEALQSFAKMLGVEDDVKFVGFVPDGELGDYYASADVFVSPSRNEPFGLTIAEAACCGTPVVSTESGVHEVLPDDSYFRCEPNSDSMRENIQAALGSETEPVEPRSWSKVAEELENVYREISSRSSTSPWCTKTKTSSPDP